LSSARPAQTTIGRDIHCLIVQGREGVILDLAKA